MQKFTTSLVVAGALLIAAEAATAQSTVFERREEAFASENAILDTSIPFAIGARQAEQNLRGSFGWPTFQEGLVDGVYFRFDPDGYARFSPSPRLDTDVFEVVCRPRTYTCQGQKPGLTVLLNERGQLQLVLPNAVAGDTFALSDGVSELALPERILQPLDIRLETLLASGGELIVRRGSNEIDRISLKGFSAVAAYLRWVAARQDYTVLPRGWPVPNSKGAAANDSITKPAVWASPMPQPQVLPTSVAPAAPPQPAASPELEALRAEIAALKSQLATRTAPSPAVQGAAPAFGAAAPAWPQGTASGTGVPVQPTVSGAPPQQLAPAPVTGPQQPVAPAMPAQQLPGTGQAAQLQASAPVATTAPAPATTTQTAAAEPTAASAASTSPTSDPRLDRFEKAIEVLVSKLESPAAPREEDTAAEQAAVAAPADKANSSAAEQLDYLVSKLGLDTETALLLLQLSGEDPASVQETPAKAVIKEKIVDNVLADIQTDIAPALPAETAKAETQVSDASPLPEEDYVTLTRYFRSVFQP